MLASFWHTVLNGHVHGFVYECISVYGCVHKCVRIEAMFFNSHWIKAFYNPLSRHNSTSLTMDLSLLCLLIIVLIHMISCFMIPLAFSLSHCAVGTNISTSVLWIYLTFKSLNCGPTGWKTVDKNRIVVLKDTIGSLWLFVCTHHHSSYFTTRTNDPGVCECIFML